MKLDCLITGVGGQGTVLLSRLIGGAALAKGLNVRGSETIGMAQRGSSVTSHIRLSDGEIRSPLIPPGRADIVIAFEPGEAVRVLPFLAPGKNLLCLDRGVMPVSAFLGKTPYSPEAMIAHLEAHFARSGGGLTVVETEPLIAQHGTRALNVALLGIAIKRGLLPFTLEEAEAALKEKIPPRHLEMNLAALGRCVYC